MSLTRSRTIQYLGLILIFAGLAGGYWYWQSQASTLNKSPTGSITSGLVGYWTFDGADVSGTTATDRGSGGNNGTLTNGPTTTRGIAGQALKFDGINDSVVVADSTSIEPAVISIVTWFKADATQQETDYATILGKANSSAYYLLVDVAGLDCGVTGAICGAFLVDGSYRKVNTPVAVSRDEWHQAVMTYDGASVRLYLDNSLVETTSYSGSITYNALSMCIGADVTAGNACTDDPFTGSVDEVRIYNRALSSSEIESLYNLGQPDKLNTSQNSSLTNGLVGLWSFNGADISGTTAYDRSGAGNNGTLTNGPARANGVSGQALNFDGSDDIVNLGSGTSLDNIDIITIAAWIRPDTIGENGFGRIYDKRGTGSDGMAFNLCNDGGTNCSTNQLMFQIGRVSSPGAWKSANNSINFGEWQHVVVTYDRTSTSNDPVMYINGLASTITEVTTPSGSASDDAANDARIGGSGNSDRDFDGLIDEVRVYNRALSASEIESLYRLGQPDKLNTSVSQNQGTGRLDSGLAGYWKLDETTGSSAADSSTKAFTGTLTNMENGDWIAGNIGGGLDFDGVDEYITTASPVPDRGTVSAWVNTNFSLSPSSLYTVLGSNVAGNHFYFGFDTYAGFDTWVLGYRGGYGSYIDIKGSQYFNDSEIQGWHHITGTWDTAKGAKLYIDGVLAASTTSTTGTIGGAMNFDIGRQPGNGIWKGKVDEVRVYDRELKADEVSQLYRLTTPTGVDTGLKGYWSFNGQDLSGTTAYDRSGAGNHGTLTNSPTPARGRIGQGLSFDGSDYVSTPLQVTNQGSISAWVNATFSLDPSSIYSIVDAATGGNNLALYVDTFGGFNTWMGQMRGGFGSTVTIQGTSYTSDEQIQGWHHLVLTWNASSGISLYLDGSLAASSSSTTNNFDSMTYSISHSSSRWQGGLDEVRIYNRILSTAEIAALYNQGR